VSRHHYGARLHRFTDDLGYRRVALENELIRVEILLDKGASIRSFLHKPTDTEFMWHSPLGLRPAIETIGGDFLDGYEGGWQEIFPNGGPPSKHPSGVELPFHGEAATVPWDLEIELDEPSAVRIRLSIETARTPLRLSKTLTLRQGSGVLEIDERMSNLSPFPVELMWGNHPAFGAPFLDASCRVDVPARRASTRRSSAIPGSRLEFGVDFDWPMAPAADGDSVDLRQVPPPETAAAEWVCLSELADGWYAVTNTDRAVGFALAFDVAVFPYVWFWQMWGGQAGHPFHGRAYCCALEPWTSWPDSGIEETIRNGTAITLAGSSSVETSLRAVAYSGLRRVDGVTSEGVVSGAES
jgi:galactose mutarotase-like enzyme